MNADLGNYKVREWRLTIQIIGTLILCHTHNLPKTDTLTLLKCLDFFSLYYMSFPFRRIRHSNSHKPQKTVSPTLMKTLKGLHTKTDKIIWYRKKNIKKVKYPFYNFVLMRPQKIFKIIVNRTLYK